MRIMSPIRGRKRSAFRGIVAGEYTVNIQLLSRHPAQPVARSRSRFREGSTPAVEVIHYDTITLESCPGKEKTAVRFRRRHRTAASTDINHLEKSLVQLTRSVAAATATEK